MLKKILHTMKTRGWTVYTEPYKLNIVGIRHPSTAPNRFDDLITVFFRDRDSKWVFYVFPATTDPGTYWLLNPIAPKGTAILAEGQYRDAYRIDRHRGKYYALCQRLKEVTVLRDYDRNAILDFVSARLDRGWHGINIHRALKTGTAREVERHSAGCQVFANAGDFAFFMKLCEQHKAIHGDSFTYSLIDLRKLRRGATGRFLLGSGLGLLILASLGTGAYLMTGGLKN